MRPAVVQATALPMGASVEPHLSQPLVSELLRDVRELCLFTRHLCDAPPSPFASGDDVHCARRSRSDCLRSLRRLEQRCA
eukprot:9836691-Lingulodinium_polyedra.AAC.1